MLYDYGILQAFVAYILGGFYPGSCAMAMIWGDEEKAKCHAHPLLLKRQAFSNTMELASFFPITCKNNDWDGIATLKRKKLLAFREEWNRATIAYLLKYETPYMENFFLTIKDAIEDRLSRRRRLKTLTTYTQYALFERPRH